MHILRAIAVAAVVLTLNAVAHAQEPSQQQYEAVMRWAAGHQIVIQTATAPLQQMPEPFTEGGSQADRERWVANARAWVTSYAAAIETARRQLAQLGPVPDAGPLSAPYQRQADALPQFLDSMQNFAVEYLQGVGAIERNDPQGVTLAFISVVDAQLMIQTQFRNLNALQAESLSDGPQRYLLRSFASSYDASIAVLQARRGVALGEDLTRSSAATVRAAAEAMRLNARLGRERAQSGEAALPAQVAPEQSDFLRRLRLVYQSFDGSFAREEQMASLLDEIAASLDKGFDEVEVDRILTEFGRLDYERMADIRRRTEMVQNIQPPT